MRRKIAIVNRLDYFCFENQQSTHQYVEEPQMAKASSDPLAIVSSRGSFFLSFFLFLYCHFISPFFLIYKPYLTE